MNFFTFLSKIVLIVMISYLSLSKQLWLRLESTFDGQTDMQVPLMDLLPNRYKMLSKYEKVIREKKEQKNDIENVQKAAKNYLTQRCVFWDFVIFSFLFLLFASREKSIFLFMHKSSISLPFLHTKFFYIFLLILFFNIYTEIRSASSLFEFLVLCGFFCLRFLLFRVFSFKQKQDCVINELGLLVVYSL